MNELRLTKSFYQQSLDNRDKLLQGIPTLIPFYNMPLLSSHIPGIIPGDQIIITANTGVGKSRIARDLFIDGPIRFAKETGIKLKIFINSLEESTEKISSVLVSKRIYSTHKKITNFYKLNNYGVKKEDALSDGAMDSLLEACKEVETIYQDILEVKRVSNPYSFYKMIIHYLSKIGKFYMIKKENNVIVEKKLANTTKNERWNHYEYNEPTFVIVISDTIDKYKGYFRQDIGGMLKDYDAIKEFSEVLSRRRLGMTCNVISVHLQQQTEDSLGANTTYKGEKDIWKIRPGFDGLKSCRATQQDCTLGFALFNPLSHHITEYMGYKDLHKMKKNWSYRSFIFLKGRESTMRYPKDEISLACDFSRDHIEEMPLPIPKNGDLLLNKYGIRI